MDTTLAIEGETTPYAVRDKPSAKLKPRAVLEAILSSSPIGVAILDLDGKALHKNARMGKLLPALRGCVNTGQPVASLLAKESECPASTERWMAEALLSPATAGELRFYTANPRRLLRAWIEPALDGGRLAGVVLMCEDVSAGDAAVEQPASSGRSEQEHSLSMHMAKVSHELRTPLNAVVGLAQVMQMRKEIIESADLAKYVGLIREAGSHLTQLVEDLLSAARAEIPELAMTCERVNLVCKVEEVTRMMAAEAKERGVSLTVCVPAVADVMGDPMRIKQVLINLVGNAVKYNQTGGQVQVRVPQVPFDGLWTVEIEDTGPGIEAHEMSKVFEPFNRLGKPDLGIGGAGLGLFVTRELVIAMNGKISVKSTPGIGSTFQVSLMACETAQTA